MFLKNSDPLINWNFEACNFFTPLLQLLCYKENIQAAPSARNKIIHTHPKIKNVCVRTCVCVCAKRACVCMPVCVCVCVCVCTSMCGRERGWCSAEIKAGPTLSQERITSIHGIFQTFPLVKFSITWVNRGQWRRISTHSTSRDPLALCIV